MIRQLWQKIIGPVDGPLMLITLLLLLLSLIGIASASPERVTAQLMNLAVAVCVMRVLAGIPPQRLMDLALPSYLLVLLLLVAVALFGDISKGARRWLDIGFTRIQPSELMKITMPAMLAWYFHRHDALLRMRDFLVAVLILLLPVALIATQPDLGTAILVFAAGFFVIFFAGLSWRVMGGFALAAAVVAPFAWLFMYDYQKKRILTLIDPEKDPLGEGFHIIQSTIAIGSGGVFGKGWGEGTQAQLEFLPERHTDFIFAVFSEEFGLLGNGLLLFLYVMLIMRGLIIASRAGSVFARLLAAAVSLIFFTYAFVNMGMVSGILPVVGVPLPFISYGGTSLVTLLCGIGILLSINKGGK